MKNRDNDYRRLREKVTGRMDSAAIRAILDDGKGYGEATLNGRITEAVLDNVLTDLGGGTYTRPELLTLRVYTGINRPYGVTAYPDPSLTQEEVIELADRLVAEAVPIYTSSDLLFTAIRLVAARSGKSLECALDGKVVSEMRPDGRMDAWLPRMFDGLENSLAELSKLRKNKV